MKVKEITKRRRFLKLLKKFQELPEERLDLKLWVTKDPGSGGISPKFLLEHPCGTAGCLAGWTVAWFPKHWRYSEWGSVPHLKPSLEIYGCAPAVHMAEYFGGEVGDWEQIMYPGYYPVEEENTRVPKHLVMERLLELYNRLYKVAHKKKRFQRLIKKLNELPDERFDLRSWVNTGCPDDYQKPIPSNFLIKNKCGTTGSVGGWVVAWWPKHWHYIFGQPRLNTSDANSCPELDLSEFFGGVGSEWLEIISIWGYRSNNPSKKEVLKKVIALYDKLYP